MKGFILQRKEIYLVSESFFEEDFISDEGLITEEMLFLDREDLISNKYLLI